MIITEQLPENILISIVEYLPHSSFLNVQIVNKHLLALCDIIWKSNCKTGWIANLQRYNVELNYQKLSTIFEQIHCPLEEKIPLFTEDFNSSSYYKKEDIQIFSLKKTWRELFITNLRAQDHSRMYKFDGITLQSKVIVNLYNVFVYLPESFCFSIPYGAVPFDPNVLKSTECGTKKVVYYEKIENSKVETETKYLPFGHRYFFITSFDDTQNPGRDTAMNGAWIVREGRTSSGENKLCLIAMIWNSRISHKYDTYLHITIGNENAGTISTLKTAEDLPAMQWFDVIARMY